MLRPSLKLRLTLALLAIVSLLGAVGLTSYLTQRQIQAEVAVLCARQQIDLRQVDFLQNGVELEGSWDPAGIFIAREVEVFPGRRRPKLRGAIQTIDLERGQMTLYGREIALPEDVLREQGPELAIGRRVEVTCDVDDGVWSARRLAIDGVKASDKIKACPTDWEIDGVAPESLNIHGIHVSLIPRSESEVRSALHHVDTAMALSLNLHEMRAQAYRLVGTQPQRVDDPGHPDLDHDARVVSEPASDLIAARNEFEQYLTRARPADATDPNRWVAALFGCLPELDLRIDRFLKAAERDAAIARTELDTSLAPFLDGNLGDRLRGYLAEAQDDLADRARGIEARARTMTNVTLGIGVVAGLVALLLGYLLWRSIRRPLSALQEAARKIAEGDLGAHVEVETADELGALAGAFNHMTKVLALTTVSIDNLQNILDSMPGALILLTPERQIKSINTAAADLLAYEHHAAHELVGEPFARLCSPSFDSELVLTSGSAWRVAERSLRCSDGSDLSVSFSGAELRCGEGSLSGYVCVAQDLSDQKRIEGEVRSSLQEKELLLREVHHRVKNNMQVISSLLALQQSYSDDPTVVAGLEQSQARIRSMALIHEHLYQSSDLAEADVSAYLRLLVAHIVHSFGDADTIDLQLEIDPVDLDLDHALSLGLIVNELLANSFRHAFVGRSGGQIRLELHPIDGDLVELIVSDDGTGMILNAAQPNPDTLGLNLVRTLVTQLGGSTEVTAANGLMTRITFPQQRLKRVAS
ncbi:MAG: PAS domain S-box-containing protein [Chlamydiales bacterium]|jgi:PAS domain S-box-containing protein